MFTEKEVDIVMALVEEEVSKSNAGKEQDFSGILSQYQFTLTNIGSKLESMHISGIHSSNC